MGLLLLFFFLLLHHLPLLSCRTVTWIAEGEGSLSDAASYDSHEVPTSDDDVVIHLPTLPHPTSPFATSTLLSPSFNPSSLDEIEDSLVLSLSAPLKVSSLTLIGSFSLIVDQPLSIDTVLSISAYTIVRVRNAEVTVNSITCDGLLSLELASLTSLTLPSSTTTTPALPPLTIAPDALLLTSGPGGSNHLHHFDVRVSGALVAINAPLLLDATTIEVGEGGVAVMANELLSVEGVDGVSAITNRGSFTVTGEDKQQLVVPLHNEEGGVLRLMSSSLALLSPFHSAGHVVLSQRHHLITSAAVTLTPTSVVDLVDSALFHIQSDVVLNAGVLSSVGSSEVAVSSFLNNSGTMRVRRLVMKEGSVLGVDDSTTAVEFLAWMGGVIAGRGGVSTLNGRVGGTSPAPHILEGVQMTVQGALVHDARSVMMLQGAAQMTVSEGGEMKLLGGSVLRCDDDSSSLTVLGSLILDSTPGRGDSDVVDAAETNPSTSISLPLVCHGRLQVTGTGSTALHRTSVIAHIQSRGSASLTLQATAEAITFAFTETVDMGDAGSSLIIQNANVSFTSQSSPHIDILDIRDGRVHLTAGLHVRVCRVGSSQSPGVMEGEGEVDVDELHFEAGELMQDALKVRRQWIVERSSAKSLTVHNMTLLASSTSHLSSTLLSLSSSSFIDVETGACLTLSSATTMYSVNDSTSDRAVATLRIKEGGLLVFEGSGHGTSSLMVDAIVEGAVVVNNSNSGMFSVILRGITSTPHSSVQVAASSSLMLGCPFRLPH